ncbi:DEAD/DEAH box helicase [Desulfopila aestuarii]|uniref:Superfamily II DNA or RNA helicase, SNF2 family n=1 Tax=Desulfopila aestuarii DSM 18488 TaxID=1121416 RepID=A0A1M7Y510_9BACT|nr:DEAD/DEAH box helicase [Desulfopila aestuarii]SHO47473.1 Superfamily II DNA or RNA helicase, SNF2 family [Desulfopila aestuarii DSM 18488]
MPTDTTPLEQLRKLPPFEQSLLQFLSIVYEPAHTTLVVNCLRKLEFTNPRGNRPSATNLNHYFSKFEQLGLLNQDRQCVPEIVEVLSKDAVREGTFADYATVIRKEAPVSYYYGKWSTRCWRAIREMRIGIYTQDFDLIDEAVEFLNSQCREMITETPPTLQVTTRPFDIDWFRHLPSSFQFYLLSNVLQHCQARLEPAPEILDYLSNKEELSHLSDDEILPFRRLLFNQLLFQGDFREATSLVTNHPESFHGTGALGTLLFLQGKKEESAKAYKEDMHFLVEMTGAERVAFFGPTGLYYILSLLNGADKELYPAIADQISSTLELFRTAPENRSYEYLSQVISSHLNVAASNSDISLPEDLPASALTVYFAGLCQFWLNSAVEPDLEIAIVAACTKAQKSRYHLLTGLFAELLTKIRPGSEEYRNLLEEMQATIGLQPMIGIMEPEEPWKRSLEALIHATSIEREEPQHQTRLIWQIEVLGNTINLGPREQKLLSSGDWSKGRPVSLSRLHQSRKLIFLTPQDRKICTAIKKIVNRETQSVSYELNIEKALMAMIGHPHLFLAESPSTPVEMISGEPELLVEERGEMLHIRFAQPITADNISIHQETPTRIKVININDNHRRIAQITGEEGLTVPKSASEKVLTAIGNISSFMTVHSAIAADRANVDGSITFVEADSTIYMHLLPYGTGFRLEMFVKPFKDGGHYLKPGQGVENIMAEVNGRRLQTRRNLALEEEKARDIEELCPIFDLAMDLEQENDREWHLHDPDDCLQALYELQAIQDKVVIEWPEGEKLNITHNASMENLNLKIRTNRHNWFAMSGQLQLDQDTVIDLRELLTRLKESSSRFIKIGDGQFLALTQEFRRRLEEMNIYSEGFSGDSDNEIMIHPLAALTLEKLAQKAHTEADIGWKDQLTRIKDAQNFKPELPSTLQAELRDYQREGYDWLARLAAWGVGGCLADDMGLGKTLQSLAVILSHATEGPSLVVAPTSVSNNWMSEVVKFTPTLNIKTLTAKDREKAIQELGPFDLLITTYTLLQQEEELLKQVPWQTVILDEAQAIKNAATKRSRAAMSLQARFKLITTGTPIENHLGELWNLFHFINPGLLGSLNSFNERFAAPIERFQDRDARMKLKKLIRPFILRRIKSQVLDELPSRTEVTLDVEMSPEETHFYEALRQNAIEMLENNKEKKGRHLQILTEIMKLRQACCNSRLLDRNSSIRSAKLEVFSSLVEELIESRHKVLVFSQFIGHLGIIREFLEEKGISYQYLDGSTSSKLRKERVEAFQAGQGDVFLISLKAGGLGLNLTAADYVIHMDPWWNPAIEDQASDRAHRIGQTRPVTIYRLVCKNTIEEKIVKLHQEKRDLAGSLLEGSDMSARMNSDDLLDLIREK